MLAGQPVAPLIRSLVMPAQLPVAVDQCDAVALVRQASLASSQVPQCRCAQGRLLSVGSARRRMIEARQQGCKVPTQGRRIERETSGCLSSTGGHVRRKRASMLQG